MSRRRATYQRLLDKSLILGMRLSIHTRHARCSFSLLFVDYFFLEEDRETQYGFCEFSGTPLLSIPIIGEVAIANVSYSCHLPNHETALSSIRNLNGTDVRSRPLRIDLADWDPFLEGKTTVRGALDGGIPGPSEHRSRGGPRNPSNDPESFLASLPECIQLWRAADEGFGYPSFMKSPSGSRLWLVFFSRLRIG